jgi:hypothetical protein
MPAGLLRPFSLCRLLRLIGTKAVKEWGFYVKRMGGATFFQAFFAGIMAKCF